MEAYGAAYALQELLTVKSDDVQGVERVTSESIVKGDNSLDAGVPESFNVLVKEIQSLGMDVNVGYEPEEVDPDAELKVDPLKPFSHGLIPPETITYFKDIDMIESRNSTRELFGLDQVNMVDHISITVASPESIRSWSKGEVKNPETINYRNF